MTTKKKSRKSPVDIEGARDLVLFADSEGRLYDQKILILKNLGKRIKNGTYDPKLAPKLWEYLFDSAAKLYEREMGGKFTASTRGLAARMVAVREENMLKCGEYSNLLIRKK